MAVLSILTLPAYPHRSTKGGRRDPKESQCSSYILEQHVMGFVRLLWYFVLHGLFTLKNAGLQGAAKWSAFVSRIQAPDLQLSTSSLPIGVSLWKVGIRMILGELRTSKKSRIKEGLVSDSFGTL